MKKTTRKPLIPTLVASPFAQTELVDRDDLSADDRDFLKRQEAIITAGRKTFLEVGTALLKIRAYNGGILYKRHGTFEAYCQERWEFGKAHAYRLMDAAAILAEMSPRGDKRHDAVLPTTEKQIRVLKALPAYLRLKAWEKAVESAGSNEIYASDVQKAVRAVMKEDDIELPKRVKPKKSGTTSYRLSATNLDLIRRHATRLRARLAKVSGGAKLTMILDEILALLPEGDPE